MDRKENTQGRSARLEETRREQDAERTQRAQRAEKRQLYAAIDEAIEDLFRQGRDEDAEKMVLEILAAAHRAGLQTKTDRRPQSLYP